MSRNAFTSHVRPIGLTVSACALVLGSAALAAPEAAAISHGAETRPGEAPWMATLAAVTDAPLRERGFCGGTLIAPDRVLTAAHCVTGQSPDQFEVFLGADVLSTHAEPAHRVRGWFSHAGFRTVASGEERFGANDLAVVVLAEPVPDATPAPIASAREVDETVAAHAAAVAYGHGIGERSGPEDPGLTDHLQRGTMKTLPAAECASAFPEESTADNAFCTTGIEGEAGTPSPCPGDSGGPLMLITPSGPKVAGVFSALEGTTCAGPVHQGEFMHAGNWRAEALDPHAELAPVGELAITGTPRVGAELACTVNRLSPAGAEVTYQWLEERHAEDGFVFYVPIDGADRAKLTVPGSVRDRRLGCSVTVRGRGGEIQLDTFTGPVTA